MNHIFFYDYFSLENKEPKEWSSEFFWPVSRETTTQITLDFKEEQCRIINELGNTFEGDCFVIGHLISNKFAEVVNHYLAVSRLIESGFEIKYSPYLQLIPQFLKKGHPINLSFNSFRNIKYIAGRRLWYFQNSVKFNFKRENYSLQKHFNFRDSSIVFGSALARNYFKNHDKWVRHEFNGFMLDYSNARNPQLDGTFERISEQYTSFAAGYMVKKFGINLPANIADSLKKYVSSYLTDIAFGYSALCNAVSKRPIGRAFTTTAGSPYIRAFSIAMRNSGGKVSGFPHGYFISHHSGPRLALHELSTVDEFIAFFPGSVELFQRSCKLNPPPRNNKVSFPHDNTPDLKNLWIKYKDNPVPDKIRTVMILELSLISEWAGYYVAEAMVNYHFYYNLCMTLSKNGYNVIFKRRPKDVDWKGINIFRNIPNVKIEYSCHFESPGMLDQADAIMIQYACSSTFQWAICTNKTVVYINSGWEPWFPDVYELMKKRCRILHCFYDDRNRAVFSESELLEILERKPEIPNNEYAGKYLFPE